MSTTVNGGWLKNNDGDKFAPKTLTSQVINSEGETLDRIISELSAEKVVKYSSQSLSDEEKAQARINIGASSEKDFETTIGFVDNIDECTNTSRKYVLPDGYVYAYRGTTSYTNLVSSAINSNGETYNGVGWQNDIRVDSLGEEVATTNYTCSLTGFIEGTVGDVFRFQNFTINPSNTHSGSVRMVFYDESFTFLTLFSYNNFATTAGLKAMNGILDENGYIIQITIPNLINNVYLSRMKYVRFMSYDQYATTNSIITRNQEITDELVYKWENTGLSFIPNDSESRIADLETDVTSIDLRLQILEANDENDNSSGSTSTTTNNPLPNYWTEHLTNKIETINNLHIAGGKDCFSFPILTDIHIRQNLGKYSGQLTKRILDECYLPYALCVGDIVNRGSEGESDMNTDFVTAEALLAPIRDRLLQTQGNHDGSWGYKDYNGDGTVDYYGYNFTPEKLHALIYRKVGLVGDCHFDTSGTGYWIDDVSNKVRYIILNTHNNPYEEDETGLAIYNNMTKFKLQQSQFDLVIDAVSTIPDDDWCVLTASHIPLNQLSNASDANSTYANLVLMAKLLNAYRAKTKFSGNYVGQYNYDAVSIDVDFTSAKGEYIAHFAGHAHIDKVALFNGISVFTTRCDGNNEPSDSGLTKTQGTITEQSFDVFTVNRAEKKIYVTKIGAGDNRYWDYENGVEFDPNESEVVTYNITTTLSNCVGTSGNATTIDEDGTVTLTFTANDEYELPENVTVSGATFNWTQNTGILVLSNPTDNVIVTITAVEIDTGIENIIDTVGYKDNTRLSTSDGVTEKTLDGYCLTGMITIPAGSTLKTSGVNYTKTNYSSAMIYRYNYNTEEYITAYADTVTELGASTSSGVNCTNDGNGNLTIYSGNINLKLRLVGYGSGTNLIITIE